MSLREYLGLDKNNSGWSSKPEGDSEITKPLRELTTGEVVLGKINLMFLSPRILSNQQISEVGTIISFPNIKLKDTLSGMGVQISKDKGETKVAVFHLQDEEGVLIRGDEIQLLFESENCGQLWKMTDINEESVKYASEDNLQSLSSLIDIYRSELDLNNRGGSL